MKNKVKKTIATFIAIFAALLGTFFVIDNVCVKYCTLMTDRVTLTEDFEDLENESDLIVLATILPNKENILLNNDDGTVIFGYTLTQLNIERVFYGQAEEKTISITEEYFVTNDIVGSTLWTQGAYKPAVVGSSYVFFLKKYDDSSKYKDMYYPIDLEYGKYLINADFKGDIDNFTNEMIEVGDNADGKYREWMKVVLGKYDIIS